MSVTIRSSLNDGQPATLPVLPSYPVSVLIIAAQLQVIRQHAVSKETHGQKINIYHTPLVKTGTDQPFSLFVIYF